MWSAMSVARLIACMRRLAERPACRLARYRPAMPSMPTLITTSATRDSTIVMPAMRPCLRMCLFIAGHRVVAIGPEFQIRVEPRRRRTTRGYDLHAACIRSVGAVGDLGDAALVAENNVRVRRRTRRGHAESV